MICILFVDYWFSCGLLVLEWIIGFLADDCVFGGSFGCCADYCFLADYWVCGGLLGVWRILGFLRIIGFLVDYW